MKSQFRIMPDRDGRIPVGFYTGDGLEDMYRPVAYSTYGEANAMSEVSAKYGANCKVVKRTFRRYTHS